MKVLLLVFVIFSWASCSKQSPFSTQSGGDPSAAISASQVLAQEIEQINEELVDKVQYKISSEDLALLSDEKILTEEELQELKKFAN